ncbi:MAG: hypothetical protein RSC29_05440 [Oscillospiraceae bacterium]
MKIKKIAGIAVIIAIAVSCVACGNNKAENLTETPKNTQTSAPTETPKTDLAGDKEIAALTDKYDTYIQGFTKEVGGFVSGDYESLINSVQNAGTVEEITEIVANYTKCADSVKNWYNELDAASIIVPDKEKESYGKILKSVKAMNDIFSKYEAEIQEAIGEKSPGRLKQAQKDFVAAAKAAKVLWNDSINNINN